MTAKPSTKIFGIALPFDAKYLIIALVLLSAFVYWYNSRPSDEETAAANAPSQRAELAPAPVTSGAISPRARTRNVRRNTTATDRGILRFKVVDGSDGHIDPTLRMDLLQRLRSVEPPTYGRSLFEVGPAAQQATALPPIPKTTRVPINAPIQIGQQQMNAQPAAPVVNIPLRYYGFVNPARTSETKRGLFLSGDNVVVGAEGDVIGQRYLVVELNARAARLEDVQMKQGQTLAVAPEAMQQQ